MNSEEQDLLKRVYVQLESLRANLPKDHPDNRIDWDDLNLYNELLDKLASTGVNVDDFKIPKDMQVEEMVETNYVTHEMEPSGRPKVRHGFFKIKLDSLLAYFEIGESKTEIGFNLPQE